MKVAIGGESKQYDPEVYRFLLGRVLRTDIERWESDIVFLPGWKGLLKILPTYLDRAASAGVRHALVAIDNDGGADGPAEHEMNHQASLEAAKDRGCRTCLLLDTLPPDWREGQRYRCTVVPVQTLETWLLCVRGDKLKAPTPEQFYYRWYLKKLFFGSPIPEEAERARLAIDQLGKPDALDILRQRRSYRYFEMQLCGWQT